MGPKNTIRIVRIIARLNVGGPARHVILLTEKFRERGWVSELVAGEVGPGEASMEDWAASRGIHPIKFDALGRELHPLRDLLILWKLYRMMCRLKPDIVHTHTAKAGGVGRFAAFLYRRLHWRGLRAPRPLQVYHTFHGHVLHGYFSPLKEAFFRLTERLLARVSTRLITLSPSLREELAVLGVAPPEMVSVVPLGIELGPFLGRREEVAGVGPLRRELGLKADTPLVGIVGRLVPIKDHGCVLQAASLLVQKEGGTWASSAHFVFVGDGELHGSLEAQARELGIAGRCHFVGWRSDLPEIYESLNLVALTSRNEGTPLSLIEAMAAARPVVATRVGGVPDLVGETKAFGSGKEIPAGDYRMVPVGALARPGDPKGFSRAMACLLEDRERSAALGRAGRGQVRERYSIDRLVENLSSLYLQDGERRERPADFHDPSSETCC